MVTDASEKRFEADMKYGLIIITEENKDKQMKIPQISKKYGITSLNITSLCEMEQWKF